MQVILLIDTIIAILVRIAELIVELRANRGDGHVLGVGSVSGRIDAIVKRQANRRDLSHMTKDDANHVRRRDALAEMFDIGIKLPERDRRLLLESSLIRNELTDDGDR